MFSVCFAFIFFISGGSLKKLADKLLLLVFFLEEDLSFLGLAGEVVYILRPSGFLLASLSLMLALFLRGLL